ncbi:uncharacterized protein LOC121855305 isoform X2 [Homarus americanus]|uniref:uncharacterized protein LOC121855305 isoform X2 n=1 Tax=Homarus americanus TaxID=6706 RepID=UPI001C4509C0|nr:uncharacterized protein LOC121855305 isoform X2 [Homarus americanus]
MKVVLVVTMMGAALVAGRSIDNPAEFPDQPSGMTKAVATVGGQGKARAIVVPPPVETQGGFKPSSIVAVAPSSSSSSLKQVALEDGGPKYPDFYYRRFFNNERTGVVAEASFEDDNISTSSEQVVSYSYLAAPKDSSRSSSDSRDVVYGSGSAAKPPAQSLSLVVSPSASAAKPSAQSLTLVASPSSFEPVRTSSVAATSLSNAVPIGHSSQSNFAVHHDVSHLDTSSNYGVLHQSALSTPPPHAPHTVYKANPEHFVIKDSTFQAHPGAPTFNIPIPVPTNQANHHHIRHNTESQASSEAGQHLVGLSSFATYDHRQEVSTKKPVYEKMMEPLRKMSERFYEMASPVLKPMMTAGQRFSERFQLPKRMSHLSERLNLGTMNDYISRTVDDESLPLVAGVALLGTLGLVGIAVAASSNVTIGKRSVDDPTLEFLDQLVEEVPMGEPTLLNRLEEYVPWADSRCSKRIFCDLMTYASTDFQYTIEKRLGLFLNLLNHGGREESSLKRTAADVMRAVHQRKCDLFTCGGDQVDSSQVLMGGSGPR